MNRDRRYVVVGAGDVGVATAYRLARAVGDRVLLLDAAATTPERTDPDPAVVGVAHPNEPATALGPAAHDAWRELERVGGLELLRETGGVAVADRARPEVARLAAYADRHCLDFEVLDAAAVARRWPVLRLRGDEHAFVQRRGGVLDTARAAAVHLALARGHGAEVRGGTAVHALRPGPEHVEVVLDDEIVTAEHVVVAAGAATATVLDGVRPLPLRSSVAECGDHTPTRLLDVAPDRFPVFSWFGWSGGVGGPTDFSGLGAHHGVTTRLVQHGGALRPGLRAEFLATRLPGVVDPDPPRGLRRREVATLPDGQVVLDTLVEAPRVSVVAGTAVRPGFAALFGRVLAGLALTGRSRLPLDALSLDRAALVDALSGYSAGTAAPPG